MLAENVCAFYLINACNCLPFLLMSTGKNQTDDMFPKFLKLAGPDQKCF